HMLRVGPDALGSRREGSLGVVDAARLEKACVLWAAREGGVGGAVAQPQLFLQAHGVVAARAVGGHYPSESALAPAGYVGREAELELRVGAEDQRVAGRVQKREVPLRNEDGVGQYELRGPV